MDGHRDARKGVLQNPAYRPAHRHNHLPGLPSLNPPGGPWLVPGWSRIGQGDEYSGRTISPVVDEPWYREAEALVREVAVLVEDRGRRRPPTTRPQGYLS